MPLDLSLKSGVTHCHHKVTHWARLSLGRRSNKETLDACTLWSYLCLPWSPLKVYQGLQGELQWLHTAFSQCRWDKSIWSRLVIFFTPTYTLALGSCSLFWLVFVDTVMSVMLERKLRYVSKLDKRIRVRRGQRWKWRLCFNINAKSGET